MFKRILNIIDAGKLRDPKKPGIFLLLIGINKGVQRRLVDIVMAIRKDSTFSSSVDLNMCSLVPAKVLNIICSDLKPVSVLDVGCGTGESLKYFLQKGIEALGLENSASAIRNSKVKNYIHKYNLNKTYVSNIKYDLVWCFEVIEHIHPKFEPNFLQTLVNHSDKIIISAARPGQGGHGHFNEQLPQYWIDKFDKLGYENDFEFSNKLQQTGDSYSENILYFVKRIV